MTAMTAVRVVIVFAVGAPPPPSLRADVGRILTRGDDGTVA
jgi:hypothetical protein